MKTIVTGGAGFIGSHLTEILLSKGHEVVVLDSFVNSKIETVPKAAEIIELDIRKPPKHSFFKGCEAVFHLAADPSVRDSALKAKEIFAVNAAGTFNVLEACRRADVKHVVFTSTSAVYGEALIQPTSESYPTFPISNYAASKIAGEAYCFSFAHTYGIKTTVLRLANIFGERSNHGVVFDFYNKLKRNPKKLEILGDGKQCKSYLHVSDCVSAILLAFEKQSNIADVFNIGSKEAHTVDEIAKLVSKGMHLQPELEHSGGKRGWIGDVSDMLLDVRKIESLGWKQKVQFEEGVKRYVDWLKSNY